MNTWEKDGRKLHQFIDDEGFGIVVPLAGKEHFPSLHSRIRDNTDMVRWLTSLCAAATGFDDMAPAAAKLIDDHLTFLRASLRACAEDASRMSDELQGRSKENPQD